MCRDGHAGKGRRRNYRLDLDLPDMFAKVVFQGQGGLTLGGLSRRLREVRAVAPTVVLVDIRTHDLSNGCGPVTSVPAVYCLSTQYIELCIYIEL